MDQSNASQSRCLHNYTRNLPLTPRFDLHQQSLIKRCEPRRGGPGRISKHSRFCWSTIELLSERSVLFYFNWTPCLALRLSEGAPPAPSLLQRTLAINRRSDQQQQESVSAISRSTMKTLSSIQIVLTSLTFILGATLLGLSVNNYYTAISWWHVSFPFHPPGEPQNRKRFAWYGVNIRWNRFDLSPTFWSIGAGATCFSLSLLALLAGFVRPKMSLSTHSRWGRLLVRLEEGICLVLIS